ncbi:MAG: hypothetical protein IJ745_02645, partial [Bacteroidales bacterium]|nr:hypothetical protein [Bacteroidales bacterium]
LQRCALQGRAPAAEELWQSVYAITGRDPCTQKKSAIEEMPDAGTVYPTLAEFVAYQSKTK